MKNTSTIPVTIGIVILLFFSLALGILIYRGGGSGFPQQPPSGPGISTSGEPNVLVFKDCSPTPETPRISGPLTVVNEGEKEILVNVVEQTVALQPGESKEFGIETFAKGVGTYGFNCNILPASGSEPLTKGEIVVEKFVQASVPENIEVEAIDSNEVILSNCLPDHEVIRVRGRERVTVKNSDARDVVLDIEGKAYTVRANSSIVLEPETFDTEGWRLFSYSCVASGAISMQGEYMTKGQILIDRRVFTPSPTP